MEKTSVTGFSPAMQRKGKGKGSAAHFPGLTYGTEPVKHATEARLLGVWYDEAFNFSRHIAEVHAKLSERFKVFKSLSGTSWGCHRRTLRTLYLSLMQSCADFALPAYAPFVGGDALKHVAKIEKDASMHVGGFATRTRITAIYGEAGTRPIGIRA